VNYGLHALMTLSMIGMLFHGWEWLRLPQILAFTLAAWWFAVQAAATRALQGSGTAKQGIRTLDQGSICLGHRLLDGLPPVGCPPREIDWPRIPEAVRVLHPRMCPQVCRAGE
jgi:hypothetical protein